jgi:IS5 family transposase
MKQMRFAMLDLQNKTKHTKRERFLAEMNVVMAWALLITLIEPHYPKAGSGRRPYPIEVMLRICFFQY